ncbi:MAG: M23 family metallopeptidase [Spirochaetaceae bacterium]|nr:MAG: M23 family metallopeptidase [Spirochaetaceae bacterium]
MEGERRARFLTWSVAAVLVLVCSTAYSDYPRIYKLSSQDVLFKQLQGDLQAYFQAESRLPGKNNADFPPLRLFSYEPAEGMDLLSLCARFNLPYDTIATLNGLDNPAAIQSAQILLIPNQPGIFVWETPTSTFQEIVASISDNVRDGAQAIRLDKNGQLKGAQFYRGQGFTPIERAYFLNILFRFPLPFGMLTSGYGIRDNPFSGDSEFHRGIDLAAPLDTEVIAARDGTVASVGFDPVLGKMIIISHEAGYQTIYGHLAEIHVRLNDEVRSGMIIGAVGTSGYSTGPHLHFEIRRRGSSRDPAPLLPLPKETNR